jgi:hypothetical protein
MSFFSSLFGKKDSQTTDADAAPANTPAPIPDHILNPPVVERKPFEIPAGEEGVITAQTSVASDAQTVAETLGGAISAQKASEVLASSEPSVPSVPAAPPEPIALAVLAQMETDLMTAQDIIAAYKIFLRRRPENMEGVTPRVGLTGDRILFDYLMSDEFTGRPEVAQLVFNCAKKILDAKKAAEDAASGVSEASPPESNANSNSPQ